MDRHRDGGLARLHQGQWQVFTADNSDLPDNRVTSLAVAPDGGLWIGTGGGLARLHQGQWQVFTAENSDLPDNRVLSLAVAPDGGLWIGTSEVVWPACTRVGGRCSPPKTATCPTTGSGPLPSPRTAACGSAPDGGLARLHQGRWQVFTAENSDLPDNGVSSLAVAPDGGLWIGTVGGLARLHQGQWQVFTAENSDLPDNGVASLAVAPDGGLWIGTDGGGLARYAAPEEEVRIVELIGRLDTISQQQHTFAVLPFDPSYRTPISRFRYLWTMKREGSDKPLDHHTGRSNIFTTKGLEDGRYTLRVEAIDRYGRRSEPVLHSFQVALPKPDPVLDKVEHWGKIVSGAGGVVGLLYFLLLFPLLLYTHTRAGLEAL